MLIDLHTGFPPGRVLCPKKWRLIYRLVWWAVLITLGLMMCHAYQSKPTKEVLLGETTQTKEYTVAERRSSRLARERQWKLSSLRRTPDSEYADLDRQRYYRAYRPVIGGRDEPDGQSGADLQWRLRSIPLPIPSPAKPSTVHDEQQLRGNANTGE